ncbi:unnamed protein product [Rotaria sp. Silwood2]|nr:unnamed protein product [Rotaria sp. Silwood2]CAF2625954.1 unnamed protein product [Rotaria sp. Silwood2]CAF3018848.1 unnamed protein product [Rotaria sp. Silwood2]CAF3930772.1 unnamed protein product [Rotaria sp. Silwood2]CAF4009125.1 unnamed protein product [Rotaria sp. Silwood2]
MIDDSDDELPSNWEQAKTTDGRIFYINHQTQTTQWEHPVTNKVKIISKELPFGWEEVIEKNGNVFYVDEQNKISTTVDPRLTFTKDPSTKDSSANYGHQSNALQILYGIDLSNKTAIVTGANTGIGFEIARSLAKHGCQVILACRNMTKGEAACAKILKEQENANVSCRKLDLCSLRNVKQFAEQYRQECLPLHFLILNAGVLNSTFKLTVDGYEEMFQVNYMSQVYLTFGLLQSMLITKTNSPPRVIAISCESHRVESPGISMLNGIVPDRLSPRSPNHFDHLLAYGQSKLCLIMFIAEFRRNYPQIYSVACHPGNAINTDLTRNSYLYRFLVTIARPFSKSLQQAAATPIFCTIMQSVLNEPTIYYNNCYEGSPSSFVYNIKLTEDLWMQTHTMVELAFKKQPLIV